MNGVQIKFYDLLRKDLHLSDDKAAAFVEALGDVVEFEVKNEKQASATKEDIGKLNTKIDTTASASKDDFHKLNIKIDTTASAAKDDFHKLNTKIDATASSVREDIHKLEIKLEQSKGDIYKAMFWTGIVQLLAILGGVLAIVKFASS